MRRGSTIADLIDW